jgi:hypothetical protein
MSEVPTFVDQCLQDNATPDQIDAYVAQWHDGTIGTDLELRELLGMSPQEYASWMHDADAIHAILAARKNQIPPLNT